jgi:hypothetical protein
MDIGQRSMDVHVILESADTLNHPRPQHLAIKSIPIHFNMTTQTVSKLTINGAADLACWLRQWQGALWCFPASLLSKASDAVTQSNQRYVLVVGSLLTDETHNCFIRIFAYCSTLLASTLAPDKF